MKNFQGISIAIVESLLILSVVFSITACGSDGSPSDDPENQIPADSLSSNGASSSSQINDNLSYSEYKDSNGVTKNFESPSAGLTQIVFDSIKDSRDNQTYPTLRIGPYIWMGKNLNYASSDFKSFCYGGETKNCKTYGRLYQSGTEDVCPEGFREPKYGDWRYLKMFVGSIAGLYGNAYWKKGDIVCSDLVGFGALPGGSCTKADSLICSDLTESAYFLSGTEVLSTNYQAPSGAYVLAKKDAFYSLRCVKPFPIVNSSSELPVCDGKNPVRDIFVRELNAVYSCSNSGWEKDSNNVAALSCDPNAFPSPIMMDSSVFICKNGRWNSATAEDAGVKCTEENNLTILRINGVKYVCDDGAWRLPTNLENEFGLCDETKLNQLDLTGDSTYYICDTTGWRVASLREYAGICNKNLLDSIVRFNSYSYVCREYFLGTYDWASLNQFEEQFGLCRANNLGIIDTATDGLVYVCSKDDSWTEAGIVNCYGICDSTKYNRTYEVNGKTYVCSSSLWRRINGLDSSSLGLCLAKNKDFTKTFNNKLYICTPSGWNVATKSNILGMCEADSIGKIGVYMDSSYVCKKAGWSALTDLDVKFGPCAIKNFGLVKTIDTTHYICDTTGIWRVTKTFETIAGLCRTFDTTIVMGNDSLYYKCARYNWSTCTINEAFGNCTESSNVETQIFNKREYVCDPSILGSTIKWHLLNAVDSAKGYCKKSLEGTTVVYDNMSYICSHSEYTTEMKWILATSAEYLGTCNSSLTGTKKTYNRLTYLCSNNEWSLQLSTITDLRDNEVYKITIIGDQTWMAEDLRYSKVDSSWCNNKDNCHSRIYSWTAAMALDSSYGHQSAGSLVKAPHRGICPTGFHIPSMSEWTDLRAYFVKYETHSTSSKHYELYYLKDENAWGSYSFDDKFGFALKPATYRYYFQNTGDVNYYDAFSDGVVYHMWFADEKDETSASVLETNVGISDEKAYTPNLISYVKTNGYSVRCLKD